ncbi:MAG: threonine synthase [Spirochaetales bacterium]|nr:threonine synthase [Spirochaetales bacterium]
MSFISTRGKCGSSNFRNAIFQGLAPDGGLYIEETVSDLKDVYSRFTKDTSFVDIAADMTHALLKEEISKDDAKAICSSAFPFNPELNPIDEQISILELYHGPSCAFKDYGASFLAQAMEYFLGERDSRAIILTATSGDTGSAVAQAFHNVKNIDVVILYPKGRVSPLQEKQLTTLGGNVHALEVEGSFDDCQRMVKEAFMDTMLQKELTLTSANSINLGRLLPQSFYYVWARAQSAENPGDLLEGNKVPRVFCVPSGNFGNLTAGILSWKWGMHVDGFIAATNINDVVPEYLSSGIFTPRPSRHTCSNAMDVGNPSNFERLEYLFRNFPGGMGSMIHGDVITDEETTAAIAHVFHQKNQYLDPHTAVGYLASKRYLASRDQRAQIITLATAHPGKFGEIVEAATRTSPPLPVRLEAVLKKDKISTVINNSLGSLSAFLMEHFA